MNEKLKIIVDEKGRTHIWMNGKKVKGIRRIEFESEEGFIPTHKIEYITQVAGVENE